MVGNLVPGKKRREYKVTNRLQEGKRPLYAICFNLIDSRFHDVFASAGGNRVRMSLLFSLPLSILLDLLSFYQNYREDKKEELESLTLVEGYGALWLRGKPIGTLAKIRIFLCCMIPQCGIGMYACCGRRMGRGILKFKART